MHRLNEYVKNSSIHGFHYIADDNRHWSERIFWIIVCGSSIYYMGLFLHEAFHAFIHNAVSFGVETDYLDWNTTFPAVSICEQESPDKLNDIGQKLYGNSRDVNIDFYLRDIAFFDGACYSCAQCKSQSMNCSEDFSFLIDKVREKCDGLIGNCMWNGKPFTCCDSFLPLLTESGLCYTINSLHTKPKWNTIPKLISNRRTGPGTLKVHAFESVKVNCYTRKNNGIFHT